MNKSQKHFNGLRKARQRRARVAVRLEEQLRDGVKPLKSEGKQVHEELSYEPLTDHDRVRIQKELETLKKRI